MGIEIGHILSIISILIGLWAIPNERLPRFIRRFTATTPVLMGILVSLTLLASGFLSEPPESDVSTSIPSMEESEPTMVTRERVFEYGQTNGHCSGPRAVRWEVPAAEGWKIELDSIQVKPTHVSSKSYFQGIENQTEDGFVIAGRIVNNGNCVRVFGKTVSRDGRGSLRVRATYKETRK